MDWRLLESDANDNPSGGLCDAYRLNRIATFEEVVSSYRLLHEAKPEDHLLLTLDDSGQAAYTSGHAVHSLDLNAVEDADLETLPPECFENGEYLGYFTTKAEFPIRARNFEKVTCAASFEDACAHELTLDGDALDEWCALQADPVAIFDQPIVVLVVPCTKSHEAMAAFPNGYFLYDLGPALNVAVVKHLNQHYGYELIGVGASYLGLLRDTPIERTMALAVATDLMRLYNMSESERAEREARMVAGIEGRAHLWVRYTG